MPSVIEENDEYSITRDSLGRTMKLMKKYATIPLPLDYPVKDMDSWLKVKPFFEFSENRINWNRVENAKEMQKNGAYLITKEQAEKLAPIVLPEKEGKNGKAVKAVSRDCVGRDADVLLAKIGINVGKDVRCIICETGFDHDFVQHELMMPILPIVRVNNIEEAIELAVKAEHGFRHTAHMHSKNIDHLSAFARAVETTIFVKNAPSYAGIGFGGEGHATFTIAGPTGEGITSARSFTRKRRCVMADSFRII